MRTSMTAAVAAHAIIGQLIGVWHLGLQRPIKKCQDSVHGAGQLHNCSVLRC